ncbi:MAG: glycoside hydrolase family 127 protein [Clostridium sp.]|nr:glycoside hydrolase family 127 protein [Clostridium sp.]
MKTSHLSKRLRSISLLGAAFLLFSHGIHTQAQSKLYPRLFDLQEVTLGDGVFKQAMELNDRLLLDYDMNRLLTPYFRQAGLTEWEKQYPNFANWGSGNFRLDGHVGGHYLSALALAYAASHDTDMRSRLKLRMDEMVDRMDECQSVFDNNTDGLYGYIGGLPDNNVWTDLRKGNFTRYNNNRGNVPLYTLHKVYAGLRDAWMYGGNEKARTCFLKLCDWGVNLIANLTDAQVQSILDTEHGGINEMYVDAYQMTGDERYLEAAKRYSHQVMVDGMQTVSPTFLDNKHANTQVPKYIGFARLAQQDDKDGSAVTTPYRKAAVNFWEEVTVHRTVALGGNSIGEHFLPANRCSEYISHPDGPESCNTNNMMKLTEDLFADNQDARYADFYEQAMLNHILSTQNPHTGGYVYFTSLRPQHYRMYSQVNQGMWCCVGTGMENHSKYGEFIYAHSPQNDTLYVNLFVASTLKNETFNITQQTQFPYEESSNITVNREGRFTLAVRHPAWCKQGFKVSVNGEETGTTSTPGSYLGIKRDWKIGDRVTVDFPMQLEVLPCPNYTDYVAFRYGPVLLGAITGTENLVGQFAGEGRMDHAPSQGSQLSLTSAPMLIGQRNNVPDSIYVVDREKLHFKIRSGLYNTPSWANLILQPFFTIHEARYMIYWNQLTHDQWNAIKEDVIAEELAAQRLNERTLDFVATGEQQSDAGHVLTGEFGKGSYAGEFFVDAQSGQWFSYQLATQGISENVSLMCRYHSADAGRISSLYINDKLLCEVKLQPQGITGFYNVEYPVPAHMLVDEQGHMPDSITVKFVATGSTPVPGLYYLRLLKDYRAPQAYTFVCNHWIPGDANRVERVTYDTEHNNITVYGKPGNNNIALQYNKTYNDSTYITASQTYLLIKGQCLKTETGSSYLWWLNGCNKGTQVAPTYSYEDVSNGDCFFIWDIAQTGLDENLKSDSINLLSSHGQTINTVFGLTSASADHSAIISDISFYSLPEMLIRYPQLQTTLKVNILDENNDTYEANRLYNTTIIMKSFSDREWTSACLPFTISPTKAKGLFTDIKKYAGLTRDNNGHVTLFFTDNNRIEKGELYLLKATRPTEHLELTGVRAASPEEQPSAYSQNGITVSGTYARTSPDGRTFLYEDGIFSSNENHNDVKGFNFFVQPNDDTVPILEDVTISFDPLPNSIRNINAENTNESIFTTDGVEIPTGTRVPYGIYIVGGKIQATGKP